VRLYSDQAIKRTLGKVYHTNLGNFTLIVWGHKLGQVDIYMLSKKLGQVDIYIIIKHTWAS